MAESTHDKIDIARRQLDTAIRLFKGGEDLFSAITLAGAAEEILGQLLRQAGIESSLDALTKASVKIYESLFQESVHARAFATRANRAKNSLKHHSPGEDPTATFDVQQEAIDMLARAVTNHWRLSYDLSAEMRWFTELQRLRSVRNAHLGTAEDLEDEELSQDEMW